MAVGLFSATGAMARVTIADVARTAGVSKTAVSFAFNAPERLGQATLDRVRQVADELGYRPHPTARALSTRRSGSIGLLIPQALSTVFANPFLSELIRSLGETCEEHDLMLLLVPPMAGSLEAAISQAPVDGFISLGLRGDDPALAAVDRLGIPTVLMDSDPAPGHPAVNVDDAVGAEAAAQHLVDLGHRRLAIISLPPSRAQTGATPVGERRLAGYRQAIARARLPEPVTVVAAPTMEAGAAAWRELATKPERPTGVLAMSDVAAIGLMAAAQAEGVKVPEQLSVVGYDDIPMAAWTTPPLTTVRQPIAEKGRLAARLLIQKLEGRRSPSPPGLGTTLLVRGSTTKTEEVLA